MNKADYNAIMERQAELNRIGIAHLAEHGYKLGDTVYMDGKLQGAIHAASGDMVSVSIDPVQYAAYRNEAIKKGVSKIIVPCGVHNFTKEPLPFDEGA